MEFVCGVKSVLFCNCFMLLFILAYCDHESGDVPKDIKKGKVTTTSTPLPVLSSKVSATPILSVPTVTFVSSKSHTAFTVLRLDVTPIVTSTVNSTVKSVVKTTVKSTATTIMESTVATMAKPLAKHSGKPSHHTKMSNAKLLKTFKAAVKMMKSRNLTGNAKRILVEAGLRPPEKKVLPPSSAPLVGTSTTKPKSDKPSGGKHSTPSGGVSDPTSEKLSTESGGDSDTTSVTKPSNTPSGEDLRNGPAPAGKNLPPGTSHFAVVFLVLIALLFGLYALYHNRQKIIAVVVEGRLSGGRGHRERYRKLDTKVEPEARIKNSDEVYVY